MTHRLLLLAFLSLFAGRTLAQTTDSTTTSSPTWLIYDQSAPKPAPPHQSGQGTTYVPLDHDVYRLIDRYAIKYGPDSLNDPHTSVRPYTRASVARLGQRMLLDSMAAGTFSRADRFNARYLLRDNWPYTVELLAQNTSRKPILKHFYRNTTDLFHVEKPDFTLRISPVAYLSAGRDSRLGGLRYLNTRGIQVEGTIDKRLGFYTFLADNQMAVPGYVQDRIQRDDIVPHEGYWKFFKTVGGSQYDFLSARGYITYAASKHINVQFGHDRNFIGNGYRSLILSDYTSPYLFLKLNTRIWKFNYQNLFTEMTAQRQNADTLYQKKYMVLHHLSLDVTPNFNIGVFESEVLGRRRGRFELQYLNPIIFYRAIEQQLGSQDNALLGLDFKWNIKRRYQLYGQFVLDELRVGELLSGDGWWGNKQAIQLGAKYLDVAGIQNFDLQGEFNYVRPYMYQHEDIYRNYQHYNQPLAHPMGANLYEFIGIASYQPSRLPRLNLVGKAFYSVQGLDIPPVPNYPLTGGTNNYGGNVLYPYGERPLNGDGTTRQYGFQVGDGNRSKLLHLDLTASYQLRQNLWLDAKQIVRHRSSQYALPADGTESYTSVSLRWNIAQRLHEF
ncbi:hypothetical protein MUN82_15235 [Hymenobacter aerilatus]|uniref:Capsule assembly Wzi family protein n=1 Tax=Hymenobacter aerilatus TaxID=2932251 RepID=A0A8T9SQ56_9BACT|nr:hypothetical protein [Hymenobacter aerilatus]UOR04288.1 hypothetical protein MUN82_15235 [Hymenobacter aerilatus]